MLTNTPQVTLCDSQIWLLKGRKKFDRFSDIAEKLFRDSFCVLEQQILT